MNGDARKLYPLAERAPERARSASGKPMAAITLDEVLAGRVSAEDIRISAEVLRLQARIARADGREALAENFERAAELAAVPHPAPLRERAQVLRREYGAHRIAAFIEEAVEVYVRRNLFRRRY
jgi:propanediol dehydratase small subunit